MHGSEVALQIIDTMYIHGREVALQIIDTMYMVEKLPCRLLIQCTWYREIALQILTRDTLECNLATRIHYINWCVRGL